MLLISEFISEFPETKKQSLFIQSESKDTDFFATNVTSPLFEKLKKNLGLN
jgi:hypothetical protein